MHDFEKAVNTIRGMAIIEEEKEKDVNRKDAKGLRRFY
jgi:hypothetical protein